MVKNSFSNKILRMTGRVPKADFEEMRETTTKQQRSYINLKGERDDYIEGLPDEFFADDGDFGYYDDEDEEEMVKEIKAREKKDNLIQNLCLFSFIFAGGAALAVVLIVLGRLIVYPFIRMFLKNFDS